MTISLTFETKPSAISLTFEGRGRDEQWKDQSYSWAQAGGTWGVTGLPIIEESKTTAISLTIENKT